MNYHRRGTSIEWRYLEDGQRVRISTRTGRLIPIPVTSQETKDYKLPRLYMEQPKDTKKEDILKVTFTVYIFFLYIEISNIKLDTFLLHHVKYKILWVKMYN